MGKLTELELCKKFAELEGEKLVWSNNGGWYTIGTPYNRNTDFEYDPINDNDLLVKAILKYEVDVDHYSGTVSIASEYTNRPAQAVTGFDDESFGLSVIMCILEKEGVI